MVTGSNPVGPTNLHGIGSHVAGFCRPSSIGTRTISEHGHAVKGGSILFNPCCLVRDSAIRHLAVSNSGNVFAAAEFKSAVSIWVLKDQRKIAEFTTVLDFGGSRLAIDGSGERCVAGAYQVNGIWCYNAKDGSVLWKRKDLKRVQRIYMLPSQSEIACGFADGPLHVLRMMDGKTLQTLRGCHSLRISPFEPVQLADKASPELQTLDGSRIAKFGRESFAILSLAFGHGTIAISEAAGPTRCFDTSQGRLLWRYRPPSGSHSLQLGYNSETRHFLGIEWPYEKGGIKTLLRLAAESGDVLNRFPIGNSIIEAFCASGTRLLSSSGWLLDTSTGKLVGEFEFPTKDYPKV